MNTVRCCALALAMVPLPISASTLDRDAAIDMALTRCLGSTSDRPPATATPPAELPPGLSRGANVHVEALPAPADKAYRYEGTAPREMACGIALYGRVPGSLKRALVKRIDGYRPRWTRRDPSFYRFERTPADATYWGDPMAPGLIGVVLLSRAPSATAPTLEIDYHRELVF